MPDVLDQSSIDALLSQTQQVEAPTAVERPAIISRRRKDFENVEVRPYDFKRPERVSKDQMRALQTLHEAMARNFGAMLSGFLRTIVEVRVATCEQMTYGEFITGLPNPTSFNLVTPGGLDGQVCLEVSPLIIYPIIDRLLGGTNQDLFIPQRPMTLIENRLIGKVIDRALSAMTEAWAAIRQIAFAVSATESNPQLVQIVPPNEVVVVVGFELKMGNRAGTMNLCIPFNVIEPMMDELANQSWFASTKGGPAKDSRSSIERSLGHAGLVVSAVLARTTITLSDLHALEVGDIITTDKPVSQPAVMFIEGERKFFARLGQIKGHRALQVVRPVSPDDRD